MFVGHIKKVTDDPHISDQNPIRERSWFLIPPQHTCDLKIAYFASQVPCNRFTCAARIRLLWSFKHEFRPAGTKHFSLCEKRSRNAQIASKNEELDGDSLRFSHLNLIYQYIVMMLAELIPVRLPALGRVPAEHNHCPEKYNIPALDALENYPTLKLSEL
jgi:hypothetical protein